MTYSMLASPCKHHINRVRKCVHVTSFKLVTLGIDNNEINVAVTGTRLR